ncbi:hypothetical protein [Acinetobacter sp. MB5]|uniref:hypothetical protein n=1 Tax=Acinetobacter sp. MB5 TaxID=2069438 RepID=UPI000DD01E68|nr:hypothetical protein [Acinetobacter sp. MB5]
MAGGSQIIIGKDGIKIITPAKFEAKAGQHKFEEGQRIQAEIPQLPLANTTERYSHRLDLSNLYGSHDFSQVKYYAFKDGDNASYISGNLDSWGRTQRFSSEKSDEYKLMVCDPDDSWEVIINTDSNEEQ